MSAEYERLSAEIDSLSYPDRLRLLAREARLSADSGTAGAVLDDLYRGSLFRREMAVFMAVVAEYRPVVVAALDDPDVVIRETAMRHWLCSGWATQDDVATLLAEGSRRTRRHVYRCLRKWRRATDADSLIEDVRRRHGDDEAVELLPGCSAETVARLLPELGYALASWSKLAKRYPEVVVDVAGRELAELTEPGRVAWWRRFGDGVMAAAPAQPERVLTLIEDYGPPDWLPTQPPHPRWLPAQPAYPPRRGCPRLFPQYADLAAAAPGRLIALLAAPGRAKWLGTVDWPASLWRRLGVLDIAVLVPLARRLRVPDDVALNRLLAAMSHERRVALYDAIEAGRPSTIDTLPSDHTLELLPSARRWAEARRMSAVDAVRDDEALTLRYTALLPWTQAKPILAAAIGHADPTIAGAACHAMVRCAARTGDPEIVTGVLDFLAGEDVRARCRVLVAVSQISSRFLTAPAARALDRLTDGVIEAMPPYGHTEPAREAENQEISTALTKLVAKTVAQRFSEPALMAWALTMLDRPPPPRRSYHYYLTRYLRQGWELDIFAAAQPWLESMSRDGSHRTALRFVAALGHRVRGLETVHRILRRADPSAAPVDWPTIWLGDPTQRAQRFEHLIRTDSLAVNPYDAWEVLTRDRTDLLDVVLPRLLDGTADGLAGAIFPESSTIRRWLPRQQAAYAAILADVENRDMWDFGSSGRDTGFRLEAVTHAGRMPDTGFDALKDCLYKPADDWDRWGWIQATAIEALAWTDRPADALTLLLKGAVPRTSGAYIASLVAPAVFTAALTAAQSIPPRRLATILADSALDAENPGGRMMALRLVATLSIPGAHDLLERSRTEHGLTQVLVTAARSRLHQPQSWSILEAATDGDWDEVAAVLRLKPAACAPPHRRRYRGLIAGLWDHPDPIVAKKARRILPAWEPWITEPIPHVEK